MYPETRTLAYNLANFARARNTDVFRRGTSLPDSSYGQLMMYYTHSFFQEKNIVFFQLHEKNSEDNAAYRKTNLNYPFCVLYYLC